MRTTNSITSLRENIAILCSIPLAIEDANTPPPRHSRERASSSGIHIPEARIKDPDVKNIIHWIRRKIKYGVFNLTLWNMDSRVRGNDGVGTYSHLEVRWVYANGKPYFLYNFTIFYASCFYPPLPPCCMASVFSRSVL